MPVNYDFYENPKLDPAKETSYHLRAVTMGTVSTREIAQSIQKATSLTEVDVIACLTALSHCMTQNLGESRRVHLEGIGYFQVVLQAPEGWDSKQQKVKGVRVKDVRFRADSRLKEQVRELPVVRSSSLHSPHSQKSAPADRERALRAYLNEHEYITSREFAALCGLLPTTARRHLARLCEEDKIYNAGTRHAPIYMALPKLAAEESQP